MKLTFTLLALISCTHVMAQFTIKDVSESNDDYTFLFPVLTSTSQPEIAKKINKTLQISELNLQITPATKDPLANIKNQDEYYYRVASNNSRVFSVEITNGYNGAGSHYQFRNYSFDARTGNAIDQNILFYAVGQVKVRQVLYKAWKETIKANLNDGTFAEEYKNCLAEAEKMTELFFERISITDNAFKLWGGSCLDGSSWMADKTLGPHYLSYDQLLATLTPYGLSLFVGVPSSANALAQSLIKGKIDNKYPITLTFASANDAGELKGVIVYDKFNAPIQLTGTAIDNKILFHEMDAANVPVSDIECTWDGKNLNGTFKNVKSGKVMSFAASKM